MKTYEQVHNEALELGKKLIETNPELREWVESKFPELKENPNEKVKKNIVDILKIAQDITGEDYSEEINWLNELSLVWTKEDEEFEKHILPRILSPYDWTMDQNIADGKLLKEFIEKIKNKYLHEITVVNVSKDTTNELEETCQADVKDTKATRWKPTKEQLDAFAVGIRYIPCTNWERKPLEMLYDELTRL